MDAMQRIVEQMAEMDGRIRTLEGGQRSGLSSIQFDFADDVTLDIDDDWSTVSDTLPSVTVLTGERLIVGFGVEVAGLGNFAENRAGVGTVGVGIDGDDPDDTAVAFGIATPIRSYAIESVTGVARAESASAMFLFTLPEGEHTFQFYGRQILNNPGGTIYHRYFRPYLMVIPLGVD